MSEADYDETIGHRVKDNPVSLLYTTRQYPCGCRAEGAGDIPAYCAEHGAPPQPQPEGELANAKQRIREFDSCIQKVAAALHACCGGVDGDQAKEGATTRVLLEKIEALKAGIRPIA